jgi:hypothetical protein
MKSDEWGRKLPNEAKLAGGASEDNLDRSEGFFAGSWVRLAIFKGGWGLLGARRVETGSGGLDAGLSGMLFMSVTA